MKPGANQCSVWNMRILVLGGYGFIGAEIARALLAAGHEVVGLGRNPGIGRRLLPDAEWVGADIAAMSAPEGWTPLLKGVGAVINAAGALQDGGRDRLAGVHDAGIRALIAAAERAGVARFIQISAPGAKADASTLFLRTKAAADAALRASALQWVIFKPGLVIGRNAFGGTALLRLLAGIPFIEVLAFPNAIVHTIATEDVTDAVLRALGGDFPARADFDLVESDVRALREIVRAMRRWLGFPEPIMAVEAPAFMTWGAAVLADMAGALGWRSPLRSTAMRVLSENVVGDPEPWRRVIGRPLKTFSETLADMPATAQERLYARAQLAMPFLVCGLATFWIVSGLLGLVGREDAAQLLPRSLGAGAMLVVIAGSLADIALGAALLIRRLARRAALGSAALAAFYLALGTLWAPGLWLDPLGVYVKVIPAILASLTLCLLLEER